MVFVRRPGAAPKCVALPVIGRRPKNITEADERNRRLQQEIHKRSNPD
jgi:hypothetical protein